MSAEHFKIPDTNTPKALIYCRVSSARQVEEGHGLDSQATRCREYAERKGYEGACCTYGDEDSLRESSALDRRHAEALSHPLSHDELVRLQRRATPARLALGLV